MREAVREGAVREGSGDWDGGGGDGSGEGKVGKEEEMVAVNSSGRRRRSSSSTRGEARERRRGRGGGRLCKVVPLFASLCVAVCGGWLCRRRAFIAYCAPCTERRSRCSRQAAAKRARAGQAPVSAGRGQASMWNRVTRAPSELAVRGSWEEAAGRGTPVP